jgi:hypothetical protein
MKSSYVHVMTDIGYRQVNLGIYFGSETSKDLNGEGVMGQIAKF